MTANESHHPLDPEEQALARRWSTLPDGEPPAALDARIRAQAHAAARASRPKVRPWAWGLSTAAAAVLAVGLLWQTGMPPTSEEVMYRTVPGPAPEPVGVLLHEEAAAVATDAATEAAIAESDVAMQRAAPEQAAPPAASPERSTSPAALRVDGDVAPEPAQRRIEAQPMPAPSNDAAAAKVRARQALPEPANDFAPRLQPLPPPPPPPAAAAVPESGSAPPAKAIAADETAEEWLARIEALLDAGEEAQALDELQAFVAAHPRERLPRRLRALLDAR